MQLDTLLDKEISITIKLPIQTFAKVCLAIMATYQAPMINFRSRARAIEEACTLLSQQCPPTTEQQLIDYIATWRFK